jgi:hypothetical protein
MTANGRYPPCQDLGAECSEKLPTVTWFKIENDGLGDAKPSLVINNLKVGKGPGMLMMVLQLRAGFDRLRAFLGMPLANQLIMWFDNSD